MRPRYWPWAFFTLEPTILRGTRRLGVVPRAARLCSRGGLVGSAHPWPNAKSRPEKHKNSFARSVFITPLLLLKAGPPKRPPAHRPHRCVVKSQGGELSSQWGQKPTRGVAKSKSECRRKDPSPKPHCLVGKTSSQKIRVNQCLSVVYSECPAVLLHAHLT